MVWSNTQDSKFEAELSFPLPEGGSVCGYAVDVDNKLVPGVIVGKEKARATFEAEVRKDRGGPALIEQSSGNVFTTRINPFLPFGHRTIQVTFTQDLTSHINSNGQTVNTYILPFLPPPRSTAISTLSIEVSGSLTPQLAPLHGFIDEETLKEAFWTSSSNGQVGTRTKTLKGSTTAWRATEPLTLELTGSPTDASVVCEHCGPDTISIAASIKNIPTGSSAGAFSSSWSTSKIGLLWDISKSRVESEADIMMELGAVQAVLNHLQYQSSGEKFELDLFPFNATVSNTPITFDSNSLTRVTEKINDSSTITYHGGTNYSALSKLVRSGHTLLGSMLSTYKFWILVTDGISTFGEQTVPDLQAPVYIISAATSGDPTFLRRWARQSNGKYFNLRAGASHDDIIKGLTDTSTSFLYATLGDIALTTEATPIDDFLEVQPLESKTCVVPSTPKPLDTGSLRFYARINLTAPKYAALLSSDAPTAILTAHFGAKSTATVTHRHSFEVDLHELLLLGVPSPVAISERAWAQARLAEVHEMIEALGKNTESEEKTRLEKEQLSLSRHFTVVTPNTSLIVLDTLQQFLDHMICPPMALTEIYKQYQKRIAARVAEEESKRFEKTSRVHSWWQRRRKWADENEYVHQRASSAVHDQDGIEIDEREIAFRTFGTSELDFKANRHVFHEYAFDGEELNGAPITSRDSFNQQWHMASPGEKKWPGLPIRAPVSSASKSGRKGQKAQASTDDYNDRIQFAEDELDELLNSAIANEQRAKPSSRTWSLKTMKPPKSAHRAQTLDDGEDDILDCLMSDVSAEFVADEEEAPGMTLWSLDRSVVNQERDAEALALEYEEFMKDLEDSVAYAAISIPEPAPSAAPEVVDKKKKSKSKKKADVAEPMKLSDEPRKNKDKDESRSVKLKPQSSLKDMKPASPRSFALGSSAKADVMDYGEGDYDKKQEEKEDSWPVPESMTEEAPLREYSRRRLTKNTLRSSTIEEPIVTTRSGKSEKSEKRKEKQSVEKADAGPMPQLFLQSAAAAPPRDADDDIYGQFFSSSNAAMPMPAEVEAPAPGARRSRRSASPPPPPSAPTSVPMPAPSAQAPPAMPASSKAMAPQQPMWAAPSQMPFPSQIPLPSKPLAPPKPAPSSSRNRAQVAVQETEAEERESSRSSFEEQDEVLSRLDSDMRSLKDMSRDISSLVEEQSSLLDSIDSNVMSSSGEALYAQRELASASSYSSSSSTGKRALNKIGGFVSGLLSRAEPSPPSEANPLYQASNDYQNPLFSEDAIPTVGYNSYGGDSSGGGGVSGGGFFGGKKKMSMAPSSSTSSSSAPRGYGGKGAPLSSSSRDMDEVRMKIDETKSVMLENIDRVLERGERLESLSYASEELSTASMSFKRSSAQLKSKMWGKKVGLIAALVIGLLAIVGVCYMFFDYVLLLFKLLAMIVVPTACAVGFTIFVKESRNATIDQWVMPYVLAWLLPMFSARSLYYALTLSNGWTRYIAIDAYLTILIMLTGAIAQSLNNSRKRLNVSLVIIGIFLAVAGVGYAVLYFLGETAVDVCLYVAPVIFTGTLAYLIKDLASTIAGSASHVLFFAIWSTWISTLTSISFAVAVWLLLFAIVGSVAMRPPGESVPWIGNIQPKNVQLMATAIFGAPFASAASYLAYHAVPEEEYLLRLAASAPLFVSIIGLVCLYLESDRQKRGKIFEGFLGFAAIVGGILVGLKLFLIIARFSISTGNSIYLWMAPTILPHPYLTLAVIAACFIVPFVAAILTSRRKRGYNKFVPPASIKQSKKAEKKPKAPKAKVETVTLRQSRRAANKKAQEDVEVFEQNVSSDSAFISFSDNVPPTPASEVHTIDLYDPYDVSAVPAPNTPMMNQYDLVQFDRPRFSFISATPDGSDRRTMKFNLSWSLPSEITEGAPDAPNYDSALARYNELTRSRWSANDASHISRVFQLAVSALKSKQHGSQQVTDFALTVMSNLAEGHLGKVQLLRAIAYKLEEFELLEDAEHIYRRVLDLRGEEPQSYRDLALVLAKQSKYAECITLYDKILTRCKPDWDARFSQVEVVALMDLCGILPLMDRMETSISGFKIPYSIVPALSSPVEVDMRSVLTWDVDGLDIELQVREPDGTMLTSFANQSSTGGLLSRDFSGGYGPVEYVARRAFPGAYTFFAKVKSPCAKPILGGEATLRHTIHTDFGTAGLQKSSIRVLRFQPRHGQLLELATVNVAALHK